METDGSTRSRARRTVEANKSNLNFQIFQIVQICSDLFRSFQIFCAGGWDAIKKKRKEKNKTEGRRNVSVEVLCTVSTFSAPWSVIAPARSFQFFSDLLSISDCFLGIFPDGIDFTWLSQKKEKSFYPFVSLQVIVGGALGAAMAAGWMAAGSFLKPLVPGPLAYAAVYATSRRAAAGRAELLANFGRRGMGRLPRKCKLRGPCRII